jgi:hypothetical protein
MVTVGKYTDNNQNILEYSVLMPTEHAKALVQIVTSPDLPDKNYEVLANTLTESGIAVFFCPLDLEAEREISDTEIAEKILYQASAVRKRYKNLPFFVMGQAISSLAVSAAAASNDIYDGMILVSPDTLGAIGKLGYSKLSKIAAKDPLGYSEKAKKVIIKRAKSVREEITADTEVASMKLNNSALLSVAKLLSYVFTSQWYKDVPKGMSTLLASGDFSPLTEFAHGAQKVCNKLDDADMSDIILYVYGDNVYENVIRDKNERFSATLVKWILERAENISNARRPSF